jgi:YfiR/HmsC-like
MLTLWSKPGNFRSDRGSLHSVSGIFFCLVLCYLLGGLPAGLWAQGEDDAEYKIKLAFLYNFTQFIQWPPDAFQDANAPLMVCVAGTDPFHSEIEQELRGRLVGGHPIEIRKFRSNDQPAACHIIFIPAAEKKLAEKLVPAAKGSSTLTVGEIKGFADMGGVINLTVEQNKLRFEINLEAAMQTRLKISSKLLALAKIVKVGQAP